MPETHEISKAQMDQLIREYLNGEKTIDGVLEEVAPHGARHSLKNFLMNLFLPESLLLKHLERSYQERWQVEDRRRAVPEK